MVEGTAKVANRKTSEIRINRVIVRFLLLKVLKSILIGGGFDLFLFVLCCRKHSVFCICYRFEVEFPLHFQKKSLAIVIFSYEGC